MQRLCVADFKHPCLKLWAFNFGHPCPSLVKGEVLSPEKIRATTGGIAFLPHPFRFSDTSVNNPSIVGSASHCNRSSPLHKGAKGDSALPTLPKPHYPSKIANTLASLVKGRWIDGKAQTVALLHFYLRYIRLFYSPNFLPSRRRDCFTPTNLSIPTTFSKAHPSLTPHHPFAPHPSFSHYSSSNIHFLPVYP